MWTNLPDPGCMVVLPAIGAITRTWPRCPGCNPVPVLGDAVIGVSNSITSANRGIDLITSQSRVYQARIDALMGCHGNGIANCICAINLPDAENSDGQTHLIITRCRHNGISGTVLPRTFTTLTESPMGDQLDRRCTWWGYKHRSVVELNVKST